MSPRDTSTSTERTGMSDAHTRPDLKAQNPLYEKTDPARDAFDAARKGAAPTEHSQAQSFTPNAAPAAPRPNSEIADAVDREAHVMNWRAARDAANQDTLRQQSQSHSVEAQSQPTREAFTRARQMQVADISRTKSR